jgi:hypothetical protein
MVVELQKQAAAKAAVVALPRQQEWCKVVEVGAATGSREDCRRGES